MKPKGVVLSVVLFLVACFLVACAAGPNHLKDSPAENGSVAGFWLGLWHGIILPIAFLVSLFSDTVSIYEIHNNGGWYNFGFLVGAALVWGGGGAAARNSD